MSKCLYLNLFCNINILSASYVAFAEPNTLDIVKSVDYSSTFFG